mmetsp:Transcript_10768/g.26033  ORF Transcript_10768/g.26033 Transcript_10768/m.26033 type:complete len:116 (+) Transcript_10768:60-407(+)
MRKSCVVFYWLQIAMVVVYATSRELDDPTRRTRSGVKLRKNQPRRIRGSGSIREGDYSRSLQTKADLILDFNTDNRGDGDGDLEDKPLGIPDRKTPKVSNKDQFKSRGQAAWYSR